MALQYYVCDGKSSGIHRTISRENARASPNLEQDNDKAVHSVDPNGAIDAFHFPKNAAIASVEVDTKESSSGPFSLDAILFGKWTD